MSAAPRRYSGSARTTVGFRVAACGGSVGCPRRRPSLETTTERRTLICFRLRTLVGKLRQAFFELLRARLQAVGLAFGGIFRSCIRLGLSLRLRVGFRRVGRAAGNQKSNQNDQTNDTRLASHQRRQVKSSGSTGLQELQKRAAHEHAQRAEPRRSAVQKMPPRVEVMPPKEDRACKDERHAGQSEIEPSLKGFALFRQLEQVHRNPDANTQSEAKAHEVAGFVVDRPDCLTLRQGHAKRDDDQANQEDGTQYLPDKFRRSGKLSMGSAAA